MGCDEPNDFFFVLRFLWVSNPQETVSEENCPRLDQHPSGTVIALANNDSQSHRGWALPSKSWQGPLAKHSESLDP